jgi:hypothetical protein
MSTTDVVLDIESDVNDQDLVFSVKTKDKTKVLFTATIEKKTDEIVDALYMFPKQLKMSIVKEYKTFKGSYSGYTDVFLSDEKNNYHLYFYPDNTMKIQVIEDGKSLQPIVVPVTYSTQGGSSKSQKVQFVKDRKTITRTVRTNERGTKYVTYNGTRIPISKLRIAA